MGAAGPSEYVNLLAGSFTKGDHFSTGNTMPLVGRPWGFNHWALQTNSGKTAWWFDGNEHEYRWLRCTHMPSPWIGDYGYFTFGPQLGDFSPNPVGFFEPRAANLRPYGMDLTTAPDGMRIQLAPSMRCAILRVNFAPAQGKQKRVCFAGLDDPHPVSDRVATAMSTRGSGGAPHLSLHLRVVHDGFYEKQMHGIFCVRYADDASRVELKLSTSFISHQQARLNMHQELNQKNMTFDLLIDEARHEWDSLLSRAQIFVGKTELQPHISSYVTPTPADVASDVAVFYTSLYRALTFPRRLDEVREDGTLYHWSPYAAADSKAIRDGVLVTDNGFWDTYRTVYPLLSLLYPDHLKWIVEGWLNAYREGGWIPKWASPGYRNSMVGTYGDVVIADAMIKGLVSPSSKPDALSALRKDAETVPPPGGAVGRLGLEFYRDLHYIPYDVGVSDCVSRTLDFAFADFAIANAFDDDDPAFSRALRERARNAMRHLFDPDTRLMRPKSRLGTFKHDFSSTRWGDGYTEGSAWHHSFPAFDVDTLAKLHGGYPRLREKLRELLALPATFEPGGYGSTIHEMREMRALAMGQYGHNNQPSHHALYLFALAGDANATNKHVRKVLDRAYGLDYFAGDEDNGEMGAWFVLASIGLFAPAPGATNDYVASAPLFDRICINVPGKTPLVVTAHRRARDDTELAAVYFNDTKLDKLTLRYDALAKGGRIDFYMLTAPDPHKIKPKTSNKRVRERTTMAAPPKPVTVPTPAFRIGPASHLPSPHIYALSGDAAEFTKGHDARDQSSLFSTSSFLRITCLLFVGFYFGRLSVNTRLAGRGRRRPSRPAWKPNSHVV